MTGIEPNEHQKPGSSPDGQATQDAMTRGRFAMQVLWPSFLVAVPCVGIFFSAVTPGELTVVHDYLDGSAKGAYTLGFLLAWAGLAASSALTYILAHRPPR